jgi:hypothetical protein
MTLLPPPPPPPPPVHWASQPETEEGEAFGQYGGEGYEEEGGEYYEEGEEYEAGYDEYGGEDGGHGGGDGEPQAASTSEGGRVLLVQRPPQARKVRGAQAEGTGPFAMFSRQRAPCGVHRCQRRGLAEPPRCRRRRPLQASHSGPATPPLQPGEAPPNYKTALCRHWQHGSCSHGNK